MSESRSPGLVFVSDPEVRPALEIRINFGIFAGRVATPAELERLATWLLDIVPAVTIVSEERHEIGRGSEGSVHQVRVDLVRGSLPDDATERQELEERILERAEYWARSCISDRPSANTIT